MTKTNRQLTLAISRLLGRSPGAVALVAGADGYVDAVDVGHPAACELHHPKSARNEAALVYT